MNIIPKPELESQISLYKWEYGLLNYYKYNNDNGIIISKSYKTINKLHYIIQHRLLKFDNDFFEIVDIFNENLNFVEISKINLDEFNKFEDKYNIYNVNNNTCIKTDIKKLKIKSLYNNEYYFKMKIQYINKNNKPTCSIKHYLQLI